MTPPPAVILPVAHAGHWLASLLYLAPVVIVVGALGFQSWKDRREGGSSSDDDLSSDRA